METRSSTLAWETPNVATGTSVPELQYTSSQSVTEAVASLGYTEDVCFSPSNRRLALAAFARNRLVVFDIDITSSSRGGTRVALTGGVEVSSAALRWPHGVGFIDDDTLIVTSRGSGVALFTLPSGEKDVPFREVLPTVSWPDGATTLFDTPGSVAVGRVDNDVCEILICNNAGHTISRHVLDRNAAGFRTSGVLLQKYLDVPDGVSTTRDGRWIAVSNHNTHHVLLYENSPALNGETEPDGILRGVYYPHGLRFSADGRYLFVADAGAPYVHVYARDRDEWRGVRHPVASVRIMDDAVFRRGHSSRAQGGPKGLDVDRESNVLVVASEFQPLAFFEVQALLQHAFAATSAREQRILDTRYEVGLLQERRQLATEVTDVIHSFRSSTSWRITAPLRSLRSTLRRDRSGARAIRAS